MGASNSKSVETYSKSNPEATQNPNDTRTLGECPMKVTLRSHPDENVTDERTGSLEKCPVQSSNPSGHVDSCPMKHKESSMSSSASSGCPVKSSDKASALNTMYNVYSQPIDPTNNMPAVANQLPNPGQTKSLSTERQSSTIPKGGAGDTSTTWTYPSPQMFYNSLVRKGKLDPEVCSEDDVETVVHLHNNMNEKTWAKVMQWEGVINEGKGSSKLSRFMGRPMDLSPKAWFKNAFLGHPLPFDRHDWTIVREDGTEARYVIDYYHDDNAASQDHSSAYPDMHDHNVVKSILVDVRPAIDSIESIFARTIMMPYKKYTGESNYETLPMMPSESLKTQVAEADQVWANIQANAAANRKKSHSSNETNEPKESETVSITEAITLAKAYNNMMRECKEAQRKMSTCSSELECSNASLDLTLCIAKVICPVQHGAVLRSINSNDTNEDVYNTRVEASLENATICVHQISEKVISAKHYFPHLFDERKK